MFPRCILKRCEDLCQTVGQVFWIYDPVRRQIDYVTPGWRKILRLPEDERTILQTLEAEKRPLSPTGLAELTLGRGTHNEHSLAQPDGNMHWHAEQASPVMDEAGNCIQIRGMVQDITQRKLTEQHLWESQRRLQEVISAAPITLFALNREGVITLLEGRNLFDVNPPVRVGMSCYDILQHVPRAIENLERALAGESITVVLNINGRILDIRASSWFSPSSQQTEVSGVAVDVTERMLAQQTLVDAENRYRSLVSAMSEGIILADADGQFIECNTRAEQLLGLSRGEILHRTPAGLPFSVVHEDGTAFPPEDQPIEVTRRTGAAQRNVTLGIRHSAGEIRWLLVNTQPLLREGEATPCASVASFSDVTREREAARQLQRQRDELTHAMRVASIGELASGLAHELNQPLTAINNYAFTARELLSTPDATPREREALDLLDQISAQAVRTGEIIRRLRQFISKSRPLHARHSVGQILQDAVDLITPEFQLARVPLRIDVGFQLPEIQVDAIQIQQVLINLLKNALEAQLALPPEQRCVRVLSRQVGGMVEIAVSDSGPGLSPAARERLFETFFTTKESGLGLGLPISRSLIEAHGGKLTLLGSDDARTTFLMTLPCE